jgi:hypothetical protein
MKQVRGEILFGEGDLGDITLNYLCQQCSNGETAGVDPTFFEVAGTPVCEYCGEDMTVFSASVTFEITEEL